MEVRNCRKCGRVFNYVMGMPICPSCKEKSEAKFQEVKEYIRSNRQAGIHEVSEACEVETSQIHQWIREERLALSDDSPIGINCESCGAVIRTGRYCNKCKNEIANGLRNSIQPSRPRLQRPKNDGKDGPRMRYLDY